MRPASTWISEATAVLVKEWRTELRVRYALHTVLLFSVSTLVTVSIALGPLGVASSERQSVLPVLLWIILLFAAFAGLPRAFVHEEETHTATALRLAATPSAVFVGKLFYSLGLLAALELLVVPLFLAMVQLPVTAMGYFLAGLAGGGVGLAATSTLIAAMVAQAEGKGALFPVLAFPMVIPLLVLAIEVARAAVGGDPPGVALGQLLLYDASVVVAGLMLFPFVWNP